jgi:hypothetical protein
MTRDDVNKMLDKGYDIAEVERLVNDEENRDVLDVRLATSAFLAGSPAHYSEVALAVGAIKTGVDLFVVGGVPKEQFLELMSKAYDIATTTYQRDREKVVDAMVAVANHKAPDAMQMFNALNTSPAKVH